MLQILHAFRRRRKQLRYIEISKQAERTRPWSVIERRVGRLEWKGEQEALAFTKVEDRGKLLGTVQYLCKLPLFGENLVLAGFSQGLALTPFLPHSRHFEDF